MRAAGKATAPPAKIEEMYHPDRFGLSASQVVTGKVLRRILRDHDVEISSGGRQALERLQQEPDRFDAVLCDVMMPDLGGKDLYEAVRRTHSGLERRFVFVSGGAFTANAREFLEAIPNPKLEKPFDEPTLRQIIQDLVGRRAVPSSR